MRPTLIYVGFTPMETAASLFDLADETRANLPKVACRLLVLHAPKDRVAGFRESERLIKQVGSADKRLIALERSKHLVPLDYDKERAYAETIAFLKAKAGRPRASLGSE